MTDEVVEVLSELVDPDYEIVEIVAPHENMLSMVVRTAGHGNVIVNPQARPDLWQRVQAFIAKGGQVPAYVPPVRVAKRDLQAELDALKATLVAKNVIDQSDVASADADSAQAIG